MVHAGSKPTSSTCEYSYLVIIEVRECLSNLDTCHHLHIQPIHDSFCETFKYFTEGSKAPSGTDYIKVYSSFFNEQRIFSIMAHKSKPVIYLVCICYPSALWKFNSHDCVSSYWSSYIVLFSSTILQWTKAVYEVSCSLIPKIKLLLYFLVTNAA